MARLESSVGPGPVPPPISWIPSALSLCGLACGFMSLLASTSHEFAHAAAFIVAAVFFDGFDGAAARALRVEGAYGETMDSLADLAAFGVAPAFLAYQANLHIFGTAGAFTGAAFAAAGAVRLARFPLVKQRGYFVGLPIPMAGAFIAWVGVYASELPPMVVPFFTLATAALMVSTIQFPYFGTALKWLPPPARWVLALGLAPLLFIVMPKGILFLLALYLLLGPAGAIRMALERSTSPLR
jgi:CDP-diacylglycerol---serine O-phosphatidyltransferase